ncbi:S-adenosyl-L-methionine-dependent methyltransferase [Xylaria bambusicola]|uniref:S-adenosyl-L-methionine-dependent methyltransferase n=1 Tax=Xylaria bambusicola TaxID=326684 RepID=UPI002007AF3A|nr:S-adenosyl-L-methionine-dependent methyltransferase [Xylaria bambusicola]KAI0516895.1 S-adenosyl-L-methionine-dependent methyltransferase [Xylaria bambusicola]
MSSSSHPDQRRTPEPKVEHPDRSEPMGSSSSYEHLPCLRQVPSTAPSDTPSSLLSLGEFSTGLSVDNDEFSDRDADSAVFDVNVAQSSMSATSSIYNFVHAHGRTYHRYKQGKYWMPNDEREQERLDLQHIICLKVFNDRLALAPIQNPPRVLDFGTGTGTWAIEFALQHPESDVLGTDLSPIQPEYVPPNCRFEIDDIEDDWMFSSKFDYIHGRHMVGSISNFPKLFTAIYENLNPGGWVEMQDYYVKLQAIDGTLDGTALQRWNNMLNHALTFTGRSGLNGIKYKRWLREAHFEEIREEVFAVPGNPWPKGADQKQLGAMQMENILEGIHGMSITLFTKFLNMSIEAVEALLVEVRKDLTNRNIHFYYPM